MFSIFRRNFERRHDLLRDRFCKGDGTTKTRNSNVISYEITEVSNVKFENLINLRWRIAQQFGLNRAFLFLEKRGPIFRIIDPAGICKSRTLVYGVPESGKNRKSADQAPAEHWCNAARPREAFVRLARDWPTAAAGHKKRCVRVVAHP